MIVRPSAVAGSFYDADPRALRSSVDAMIGHREPTRMTGVIVPHAGHIYSGPVAGTAYRLLPAGVHRVVLIGPAHFVPLHGLAAPAADAWQTPLGTVLIDVDEVRRIAAAADGRVLVDDLPHAREHSLEVQLPFLQRVLGDGWTLVPFVVGHADPRTVAEILAEALPGSILVVSTDLSHYLPYDAAAAKDRRTAEAILAGDVPRIGNDDACGAYALRGALTYTGARGLAVRELDLRSSGDTAGPRDRVVGYGSFLIGDA